MQAVILGADEGTRIRPCSASVPKPMVPVADRPLVAHTADAAAAAGAPELVFVAGHHADAVSEHFGSEYADVPVEYAVQERRDETADAVRTAAPQLDGPFVVLNGDNPDSSGDVARRFEAGPAVGATTLPGERVARDR